MSKSEAEFYAEQCAKLNTRIARLWAALKNIRDGRHCEDCPPVPGHTLAPGGHECSCPQQWAAAALAKLEKPHG